MAVHDLAVAARQDGDLEAELPNARAHFIDDSVILPRVPDVEYELIDVPNLNLRGLGRRFLGKHTSPRLVSEPLNRQERVSAGALPAPDSQGHGGRDHGQVRQLRKLRQAGVRRPIIRPARLVHRLLCGAVPVVRLKKPDRDSGLRPLRSSLRHKTLGAILRGESTLGHRVFDSDVFAHSSRVMPRWDCGYACKELQKRGGNLWKVRLLVPSLGRGWS